MNADDTLRQAISEAVDEIIAEHGTPDDEVKRLTSMVESLFWIAYDERTTEEES